MDDHEGAVDRLLSFRVAQVVDRDHLRKMLVSSERPLRVKLGVDPTSPDLHIGHGVPLERLRAFQDLGHTPVLVMGDTTAQIGDPSDRDRTRPMLSPDEVRANAETYLAQYGKVVDPARTEVRWQSEWFGSFGVPEIVRLASRLTVARMIERDTFAKRLSAGDPIAMHETLYPLLQAYDSVAVQADVELGGTDQTFNLLVGRDVQRDYGQPPQQIMTVELLVGTDGAEKMSKSLGNAIGLTDSPYDQYAKTMSIPDQLMDNWARLVTRWTDAEADAFVAAWRSGELHAKTAKQRLAHEIVSRWHGDEAAAAAEGEWARSVAGGEGPAEVAEVRLASTDGAVELLDALVEAGLTESRSEGRRLVRQRGIRIDGRIVEEERLRLEAGRSYEVRVGRRRAARVRIGG